MPPIGSSSARAPGTQVENGTLGWGNLKFGINGVGAELAVEIEGVEREKSGVTLRCPHVVWEERSRRAASQKARGSRRPLRNTTQRAAPT